MRDNGFRNDPRAVAGLSDSDGANGGDATGVILLSIIRSVQHDLGAHPADLMWVARRIGEDTRMRDLLIVAGMRPDMSDFDLLDTIGDIPSDLMNRMPDDPLMLARTRRMAEAMAGLSGLPVPLAVAAYLAWAEGDMLLAARHAYAALALDDSANPLAALVITMFELDITIGKCVR